MGPAGTDGVSSTGVAVGAVVGATVGGMLVGRIVGEGGTTLAVGTAVAGNWVGSAVRVVVAATATLATRAAVGFGPPAGSLVGLPQAAPSRVRQIRTMSSFDVTRIESRTSDLL